MFLLVLVVEALLASGFMVKHKITRDHKLVIGDTDREIRIPIMDRIFGSMTLKANKWQRKAADIAVSNIRRITMTNSFRSLVLYGMIKSRRNNKFTMKVNVHG
jgi:hypothetical protein